MGLKTLLDELDSVSTRKKKEMISDCLVSGFSEDEYQVVVLDRGFNGKMPFVINNEIINVVKGVCGDAESAYEKATRIHGWIMSNIDYGDKKRKHGYRNSIETFYDHEGVCGEMSMLYISMARSVGIRASYALVDIDDKNKKVDHACSMLDVTGRHGKRMLVDSAYRRFDVNHISYRPINDFEMFQRLNSFQ